MGFSPGDFEATVDTHSLRKQKVWLHFERKAGERILLWSDKESVVYFEVDLENAALMVSQLKTLLATKV